MGRPGFSSRGDRCGQGEEFRERGCQGGGFRGRGGRGGGFRGRDDNRGFSGRDDDRGFRGRCEDRGFRGRDEDRGFRGRDEDRGFRGRDEGRGFRGRDEGRGFRGRDDNRGFRGRDDDRGFRGRGDDRGFRGRDDDRGFRGRGDDRGFRGGRCGFGGGFRNDRPRSQSGDKASLGRGGRGGSRGRGRGPKGGRNAIIEPHRHEGVFISRGKNDALLTVNLVPGDKVYNENLVVVGEGTDKIEYRTWNPFRSKLAAAIMGGIGDIHMRRGSHVLYLGASSGTTVSHVSDIVGPEGMVYAVEFSVRSGRDLISVAQKRRNIVPIIEDARHVTKYRMLIGRVDVIFSDVAQPDQARILALNADHYLKPQGHFIISIKANCIDSTASAEAVVATEIEKLRKGNLKPLEKLTLEPYERDHTVVVGQYRSTPQAEKMKE